jgi:hypothetical protein
MSENARACSYTYASDPTLITPDQSPTFCEFALLIYYHSTRYDFVFHETVYHGLSYNLKTYSGRWSG